MAFCTSIPWELQNVYKTVAFQQRGSTALPRSFLDSTCVAGQGVKWGEVEAQHLLKLPVSIFHGRDCLSESLTACTAA